MADLVTKVAKQSPELFAEMLPAIGANRCVAFKCIDGDHTVRVTGRHRRLAAVFGTVCHEVEQQPAGSIVTAL